MILQQQIDYSRDLSNIQLKGGFVTGGVSSLYSAFESGLGNKATRSIKQFAYKNSETFGGEYVSKDEANKIGAIIGEKFEEPVRREALNFMYDNYRKKQAGAVAVQRAIESSAVNWLSVGAMGFAGSMGDPGEALLGFGAGYLASGRYLSKVGMGIESDFARTAFRGGAFGALESAAGEPIHHVLSAYLKEQYTTEDSIMNIAFGTGAGVFFGSMRGLAGDFDYNIDLRPETVEKLLNERARQLIQDDNQNYNKYILSRDPKFLADKYKDYIDYKAGEEISLVERATGRKASPEAREQIRRQVQSEVLPAIIDFEFKSATKQISEPRKTQTEGVKADASDDQYTSSDTEVQQNNYKQEIEANKKALLGETEEVTGTPKEKQAEPDTQQKEGEEQIVLDSEVGWGYVMKSVANEIFPDTEIIIVKPDNSNVPKNVLDDNNGDLTGINAWYDIETGKVYIRDNEIKNVYKAAEVLLEEVVGHKGLRSIFRNEKKFNKFIDWVSKNHSNEVDDWLNHYKLPTIKRIED